VLDCFCITQRFLCYWTNTTGMTHLKIIKPVEAPSTSTKTYNLMMAHIQGRNM